MPVWRYWRCVTCLRVESYPVEFSLSPYCRYGHLTPQAMVEVECIVKQFGVEGEKQ